MTTLNIKQIKTNIVCLERAISTFDRSHQKMTTTMLDHFIGPIYEVEKALQANVTVEMSKLYGETLELLCTLLIKNDMQNLSNIFLSHGLMVQKTCLKILQGS